MISGFKLNLLVLLERGCHDDLIHFSLQNQRSVNEMAQINRFLLFSNHVIIDTASIWIAYVRSIISLFICNHIVYFHNGCHSALVSFCSVFSQGLNRAVSLSWTECPFKVHTFFDSAQLLSLNAHRREKINLNGGFVLHRPS